MRTLREIENELMDASKARADQICGNQNSFLGLTRNELIATQMSVRIAEKFRETYRLLKDIETSLKELPEDKSIRPLLERISSI